MKYINFKRFKFSTIFKNVSFQRYNFSKIFKFTYLKRLYYKVVYKYLYTTKIVFRKIYKYYDLRKIDFTKVTKYFSFKKYSFSWISFSWISFGWIKKITYSKVLLVHIPVSIIFFGLLYLMIPTFYVYDKSEIQNKLCKKQNIKCLIKGTVNYRFYPTPRLKINNVIVNDYFGQKKTLMNIDYVVIKLSIKNLLVKEKHKFNKIELSNYEINYNINDSKKYKKFFFKNINFIPIVFKKGEVIFFDGRNYVANIKNANGKIIFNENSKKVDLKGKFLNDDIYLNLNNKIIENKSSTDIIFKMSGLNLIIKGNASNNEKDKSETTSNILIKKDKHRFTGILSYKDNEIKINKSNLRNYFFDGQLSGKIKFLPYFNFDLDLTLNNINFTRLYNYFLALDEEHKKKLFKINRKINGKLALSSDKIYSNYNLAKSFESRLKFNNGNIFIEQFLINLGKLGAADVLGSINNDKKFSSFNYESNIFVDNQKKFISRFGIYNKKEIPANLFISGNFDLENTRVSFYEITDNEKLSNDDVNFIEKEFNDFMLVDGYNSLFHFSKFKEFVKSITSEIN